MQQIIVAEAKGILTKSQRIELVHAETLRLDAIKVDAFCNLDEIEFQLEKDSKKSARYQSREEVSELS